MAKSILVIGATGKQGGSLINALLASDEGGKAFNLLGVTRSPTSNSSQNLIEKGVKIVQGDVKNVPALFSEAKKVAGGPIWGVFSVTMNQGAQEETEGKALVDGAIENGVDYFVFTSVDRGGEEKSWTNPTVVPHFIAKHNVELYLKEKAGSKMQWSILRPTGFMDNWSPNFFGKLVTTMWRLKNPSKPFQMVAVKDIGTFGAIMFQSPDKWNHRALSLAGSEITFDQANKIFHEKTGLEKMPESFEVFGRGLLWAVADVNLMFTWFATDGYGADLSQLKELNPDLLTWDQWLVKQSAWTTK